MGSLKTWWLKGKARWDRWTHKPIQPTPADLLQREQALAAVEYAHRLEDAAQIFADAAAPADDFIYDDPIGTTNLPF